ncbi:MAG TPA: choice-of-anchor Q domain-containing protein, partial [Kofleriaceae bacterium]|nr:choice-of-anchor Q domain-containing protein [Kofleriaceae bacterium]
AVAAALCAAAAAAAGCKRANPIYCDEQADCESGWVCDLDRRECLFDGMDAGWNGEGCADSTRCPAETPICSADHMCLACAAGATGDADCAARDPATPTCRDDGRCVACLDAAECMDADAAFCDDVTGQCRGCASHDECASQVCNFGGACVDAAAVVYVDNVSGADGSSCGDPGSPCATIGGTMGGLAKVMSGRRTLRIAAGQSYPEALLLDGVAVVLVGPGAILQPIVADTAAIEAVNGASVTVDGLTVSGGDGPSNGDGVRCSDDGTVVRIERAEIADNDDVGVEVGAGCDLHLDRSVVTRNAGGGVRVAGDLYDIVNTVVTANGGAASTFGGVRLAPAGTVGTTRLELSTIAGNTTTSGAAGVQCASALAAGSLILWADSGGVELGPMCSVTYSDVQGGATGDGNLDADPLFTDSTDVHIASGSPCIDAADPAAAATVDIDGDLRPLGTGRDIGADEVE